MSNKRIDKLEKKFFECGEIVDAFVAPPLTYVVIRIGQCVGVGMMRCAPDEDFSASFGLKNALRQALKHVAAQTEFVKTLLHENIAVTHDMSNVKTADVWDSLLENVDES